MMQNTQKNSHEWSILQNNFEQYEKFALWLKITAIVLCFVSLAVVIDLLLVGVLIGILWLQEAIFRTGQTRIGEHILIVEKCYREGSEVPSNSFQLHSNWRANRGGSLGLCLEYARHAIRPTVLFPYVILLITLAAALSTPVV
jgi:hypothetical protein